MLKPIIRTQLLKIQPHKALIIEVIPLKTLQIKIIIQILRTQLPKISKLKAQLILILEVQLAIPPLLHPPLLLPPLKLVIRTQKSKIWVSTSTTNLSSISINKISLFPSKTLRSL